MKCVVPFGLVKFWYNLAQFMIKKQEKNIVFFIVHYLNQIIHYFIIAA